MFVNNSYILNNDPCLIKKKKMLGAQTLTTRSKTSHEAWKPDQVVSISMQKKMFLI